MTKYIVSVLITISLILFKEKIADLLISNTSISWTFNYWLLIILIIIGIIVIVYSVIKLKLTKPKKILLAIITPAVLLALLFIKYPIYLEDLNKSGTTIAEKEFQNNFTIESINKTYPNFDGVISIASTTCPHCMVAAKKLNTLKLRHPEINVLFVMFTLQQDLLDEFRNETNTFDIDYILAPDEKGTLEICQGRFPTFVYLKNGKIIHQWTNNELGYPAFDWIEKGLN